MSASVTQAVSESFVIEGGFALSGRIRATGNKNGALPILAACMLSTEPVRLTQVPRIRDVDTTVELPPPGGDVIGRRRLDTHIHAFEQLGARIEVSRRYTLRADRLIGRHVF